jgi:hypothetical protein
VSNILYFPIDRARPAPHVYMARARRMGKTHGRMLADWRTEVIAAWDAGKIDAPRAARLLCTIQRQLARHYGISGSATR